MEDNLYTDTISKITLLLIDYNDKNGSFSFFDNIDLFSIVLNSIMCDKLSCLNVKDLINYYHENEKEAKKIIEQIRETDLKDEDLMSFVFNIKKLLNIFVRYKK